MAGSQVVLQTGGIGLDTRDFLQFSKALRKAQPVLSKGLRVRLAAVGELVATKARSLAEEASTTIPPSIKVRISNLTVAVVAGGNGVPLAGLMELGNKGARTARPMFRHPVFGMAEVWVSQPTHPYLLPALEARANVAEIAAIEALDEAIAIAVTEK